MNPRKIWIVLICISLSMLFWSSCVTSTSTEENDTAQSVSPQKVKQVLVVTTSDWDTAEGTLTQYELWESEAGDEGEWKQAGEKVPVLIGKNGLGWGIGLEDYRGMEGPVKQEGDLKSPAGIFALGTAFGYALPEEVGAMDWEYTPVVETTMCIEDTGSVAYNRILDEGTREADWTSTDHMLRDDDLYEWGVFVLHNAQPAVPGGGSCIFLHVWREGGSGTAGCTSMAKGKMKSILDWLDPDLDPVLIQVTASGYPGLVEGGNWPDPELK